MASVYATFGPAHDGAGPSRGYWKSDSGGGRWGCGAGTGAQDRGMAGSGGLATIHLVNPS